MKLKVLYLSAIILTFVISGLVNLYAQFYPYQPRPIPDRIILTMKTEPAGSISITWRTDTTVSVSIAEICKSFPANPIPDSIKVYKGGKEDVFSDGIAMRYHSVNITGLMPEASYNYRVGNGEGYWSEWFQFTTASHSFKPFSFIFMGDVQNDIKSLWSIAIRKAYSQTPDARFIIYAGDLVDGRVHLDNEWGEWHHAGSFINGMIPAIPAIGNHEYYSPYPEDKGMTKFWKPGFALPENGPAGLEETVFFTDYQGVRIITLNSQEIVSGPEAARIQSQWLEKILKVNPNKWTIVVFHHPMFSISHNRDNPLLREYIKPILEKYRVDVVLQGNDHIYGRGMNSVTTGLKDRKSWKPFYLVSVSGSKLRNNLHKNKWWDHYIIGKQLYQIIHVKEKTMEFEVYDLTGELVDHFSLKKSWHGSNKFVETKRTK